MSDNPDNLSPSAKGQLAVFEDLILIPLDDRAAVAEMHGLIKRLLANDSNCEN